MGNINDLKLNDEVIEVPADIPEEREYTPLPQPGTYVLKLPDNLEELWSSFKANDVGQRVSIWFDRDNPLYILDSPAGEYNGQTLSFVGVNNVEKKRRNDALVSEMTYLIRALEVDLPEDEKSVLDSNQAFHDALIKHGGEKFKTTITWMAGCSDQKDIRILMDDNSTQEQPGQTGCNKWYYSSTNDTDQRIPQDEETGKFETRFACWGEDGDCPAILFSKLKLGRFRTA